jgi:two-component sensor histidine kinase
MTKHIVQLPNPDGSLLLREWNHRIKNELTSAIYAISAKAVQSDSVAAKAALLDVVDLLHQCADVHRALHMPDQAPHRCREVRSAALLRHHEIPIGPPGDTCLVFSG